jgi:hypothetical protein
MIFLKFKIKFLVEKSCNDLRDSDHVNDEIVVKEFLDVVEVSHEMNIVIDLSEDGTQIGQ